ncbi:MAG: DUF4173 domain-containing protein [Gemmatimonadaceae bacterium]
MQRAPDDFAALSAGHRTTSRDDATGVVDATPINRPLARRVAGHAILLGIAGDALLRDLPVGIAFPAWIALAALGIVAATWSDGRSISREVAAWLATALLFSCGLAWRDSSTLQALDVLATIGSLGMAAIALSDGRVALLAARFRDTVWAAAALAATVMLGILPMAFRELFSSELRDDAASRIGPVLRAALIGGALLLLFGALLRDADPIFASLVTLPSFALDVIARHVVVTGFYTWIVAGWARGALLVDVGRRRAPTALPFRLSALDITTALGTLNVLFAAFVVAQLGWFFGGEAFLHERTGLTASAYARQGFFQMLWVALLVIPLLLTTRAALEPSRDLERRHTALSIPLIVLLGAMLLSAATRMKLYVHYYGLTTERLYPMVFMAWLAMVLVWLAVTVLRGRGRTFIAGVAMSGLAVLAALNVAAPDAYIARFNVARAANASRDAATVLDLESLARLSGEAAGVAVSATLTPASPVETTVVRGERCEAAKTLLQRWGPVSRAAMRFADDDAWRFWNAGQAIALAAVGAHSADLRRVAHRDCAVPVTQPR